MVIFKYEIIRKTHIELREKFPKHFLGDTIEEAEDTHRQFSGLLNTIAYNYSMGTGIEKYDIFGEALTGLARAKKDFDPNRSDNFRNYAIYRIRDAINTYVRGFGTVVRVPAYLKAAHRHLGQLQEGCPKAAELLRKAAKRAGISTDTLIRRAELIPLDVEYEDQHTDEEAEQQLYTALVVERLKKHMKDDELYICDMIMAGNTYEEIAETFGKTPPWVVYKLRRLRERLEKGGENSWGQLQH